MHSKTTNQTCTVPYVTSSNLLILAFKDLVVLQALYNLKQTIAFSSINLTDYIAFQTIHYILACPCERLWHQESAFGVQLRIRMCIVIGLHYGLPAFNKFIFLGCYLCLSVSLFLSDLSHHIKGIHKISQIHYLQNSSLELVVRPYRLGKKCSKIQTNMNLKKNIYAHKL